MEGRAVRYINDTSGGIQAALILKIEYPQPNKAEVGLFVSDTSIGNGSSGVWVLRSHTIYDSSLNEQPVGQVELYLSDFLGYDGLPAAFQRPTAAELADQIIRFVFPSFSAHDTMRLIAPLLAEKPRLS